MTKKKKSKVDKKMKLETLEEFLARGGVITTIPPEEVEEQPIVMKPITPLQIMPLDHGEHFFAEKQTRKKVSNEDKNKKGRDKLTADMAKYLNK